MTTTREPIDQRVSLLEWSVRAAWLIALLAAALQLLTVLVTAASVPAALSSNPVTASIETSLPLHAVGHNSYGGTAYVADSTPLTVTRVTGQVRDPATSVRVGLAFGPLVWAMTGAGVAMALTFAFGRLVTSTSRPGRASRAFAVAAAIGAVGTSIGQILDEIARTGLQGVMWHSTQGMNRLGSGSGFTFQFGWLAASLGLLAIAAAIRRIPPVPAPAD